MPTTRRDFLVSAAAGAAALHGVAAAAEPDATEHADRVPLVADPGVRRGDMLYRKLGRTGVEVSALGIGGFHLSQTTDDDTAVRIVRRAVDAGVTFMDNSWDYAGGASETRMGKALRDGYRDRVFLMTKIDGRTKQKAAEQIDESLRRLGTDRIDLIQHHEVIRFEDPDRIFAPGGAQEAMLDARKAGKVRFVGFTGHKDPQIHRRMLDVAARHGVRFDAVQMPLNPMDAHFRSFGRDVLPRLVREQIGVLGMKPMGSGILLQSGAVQPVECLHYALSLPTSVVITGIDKEEILDQALGAVRDFRPLHAAEMDALLRRTATAAADGRYEKFKTSSQFDSTAKNPEWLG